MDGLYVKKNPKNIQMVVMIEIIDHNYRNVTWIVIIKILSTWTGLSGKEILLALLERGHKHVWFTIELSQIWGSSTRQAHITQKL